MTAEVLPRSLDPMAYGATANGKDVLLKDRYGSFEEAKQVYPHARSDVETIDWAAWQAAANEAEKEIKARLPDQGDGIGRASVTWARPISPSVGHYRLNCPVQLYPHVSVRGSGWGGVELKLADSGWAQTALRLPTNPGGIGFMGPTQGLSALLWLRSDLIEPEGSGLPVGGMVNSISNLALKCHSGPGLYFESNQNQIGIEWIWFNGYGAGPTGLGLISNNATSSTQVTNLTLTHCFFEGCAGAAFDRIVIGHFINCQFDDCRGGIYVGSAEGWHCNGHTFSSKVPSQKFMTGIELGCGLNCRIQDNTFSELEGHAIKVMGRDVRVTGNDISMLNGGNLKEHGYGIHVVTPAKQFGGDTSVLGGVSGPYRISDNTISCDVWPPPLHVPGKPSVPLQPIWLDEAPGEQIIAHMFGNITGPQSALA